MQVAGNERKHKKLESNKTANFLKQLTESATLWKLLRSERLENDQNDNVQVATIVVCFETHGMACDTSEMHRSALTREIVRFIYSLPKIYFNL